MTSIPAIVRLKMFQVAGPDGNDTSPAQPNTRACGTSAVTYASNKPMPAEHSIPEEKSRRTLIIFVAAFAAAFIAAFFYLLLRSTATPTAPPTLAGAVRAGSPDFEKYKKLIVLDDPEADEAKRALGDTVMTLQTTVRNFTGRTITGLEVKAAVVDHDGKPVKERTVVVIPGRQSELDPNKTLKVPVRLEGFTDSDDRANIKMEVTGFTLK